MSYHVCLYYCTCPWSDNPYTNMSYHVNLYYCTCPSSHIPYTNMSYHVCLYYCTCPSSHIPYTNMSYHVCLYYCTCPSSHIPYTNMSNISTSSWVELAIPITLLHFLGVNHQYESTNNTYTRYPSSKFKSWIIYEKMGWSLNICYYAVAMPSNVARQYNFFSCGSLDTHLSLD